jgi:ADP-sugar diphosphatase
MIKTVFQVTLKNCIIPVFKLPHLEDALVEKTLACRKFKNYTEAI